MNDYFDSYQEHMDHEMGSASELQNAYALSQQETSSGDRAKLDQLVKEGKFVVVLESVRYCSRTDAILPGTRVDIHSVHSSYLEAIYSLGEWESANIQGDDTWYAIYPSPIPVKSTMKAEENNTMEEGDIPF